MSCRKPPRANDLSAFRKSAEVTLLAAFFEADGLAALRACDADQAACLVGFLGFAFEVTIFQNPGDSVGNGEHKATVLKYGMFAADAFELVDNVLGLDPAAQSERDQPANGLGLSGCGAP